jgi:AraC-like DNA-binding protein
MENPRRHKTKQEFALELGLSRSTLYRRLRELNLEEYLGGGLLSPAEQDILSKILDEYRHRKKGISP